MLVLFHGDSRRKRGKANFLSYNFTIVDGLSFVWQFKEIFTDEYYNFKSNKTRPVIYDCGANIGLSVVYFKTIYPDARIKAFEADPAIAETLKTNIAGNKLQDVEIYSAAVWINNEGIEFVLDGSDAGSILGNGTKTRISSVRLKDLLQSEKEIDFLKMDIEGAETEVLKDCKDHLRHIRNMFIEYHSFVNQQQELDEILSILRTNNFRYYIYTPLHRSMPLIKKYRNETGMDLQINIFAYNTTLETQE